MTEAGLPRTPPLPVAPATGAVCPYLLAGDGAWRASTVSSEHRCTAVAPPAILAHDKQRRLCLVAEHQGCTTYVAATGLVDGQPQGFRRTRPSTRPITRTTPLILDRGRFAVAVPAFLPDRGVGQGGLVALMAAAFGALVVARLSSGAPDLGPSAVGAGGSPTPLAAAIAATGATPTTASVTSQPVRTLVPSEVEPTATASTPPGAASDPPAAASDPAPTAPARPATYTVRKGDTLSGIAGDIGTTWQVLAELNGIDDPGRLRVGQVLDLP